MDVILTKQPYSVSFSGNPIPFIFTLTPYGDLQKAQDYKLQVNVLVEDVPGLFLVQYAQTFFPDAAGVVQIDIKTIIDAYLVYYTPRLSLDKPVNCDEQRKRYKISYQLQLADDLVTDLVTTDAYFAIKGGMSYETWDPVLFFQLNILSTQQPLQFSPDGEKTTLDQYLFFYWLYPYESHKQQRVIQTFYFDDGTNDVFTHADVLTSERWGVCVAPVGYAQISYTATKTIKSFTVQVKDEDDTQIAAPFTYTIDYRSFYNTYSLLYRNSLGGLSTIRLRGEVDAEADYAYQQATRINAASYYANNILLPQIIQQPNYETAKFTGDTGFVSKNAINNLRDLFLSKQIFEIVDGRLIPIISTASNAKLFTNKNSLFSLQLTWQHAFQNEFYTQRSNIVYAAVCPQPQIFTVVQVNKNTLQIVWCLQTPYDTINVTIDNGVDDPVTYTYTGNTGSILQSFNNPATDDPVDITVSGQTVCDADASPPIVSVISITVTVSVIPNSKPVAVIDTFNINTGFDAAIDLNGNVLDNDYDPDGDPIEATAASGSTYAGGSYTLNTDGTVSYTPPSSDFTGQDYFQYKVHEVADPTSESAFAKAFINVGSTKLVYVRLTTIIDSTTTSGPFRSVSGRVYLYFFDNVSGTSPMDITGLGLNFNVHKKENVSGTITDSDIVIAGSSTAVKIYEGKLKDYQYIFNTILYEIDFTLEPGTGYTVIP